MGLIRRANGFYYVRIVKNGTITLFSLKTKIEKLAVDLYQSYLVHQMKSKWMISIPLPDTLTQNPSHDPAPAPISEPPDKPAISDSPIYEKAWQEYFETRSLNHLSKSQLGIKKQVHQHLLQFKPKIVKDIDQQFFNQVFKWYGDKYRDDSIRKFICEIKCFLNFCIKNDYYPDKDYRKLSFPKTITKVKETLIKEEDIRTILEHLKLKDTDFYNYILSLINLCGRPNEIPSLQKKNFNIDQGYCKYLMNKTQKLKTVILTDKSYIEYMKKLTAELNDNDYIFKGHIQGPSYYPNKFKRLKEKLNLNSEYFLYTFRHTVGTKIYQETKDLKYVANQLGDKEETVLKHYVNISLEQFEQYRK